MLQQIAVGVSTEELRNDSMLMKHPPSRILKYSDFLKCFPLTLRLTHIGFFRFTPAPRQAIYYTILEHIYT